MTAMFFVWALPMLGVSGNQGVPRPRPEAASTLLYALPEAVQDGRPHQLEVVVTQGLPEALRESAAFRVPKGAVRPVVEVLALHPQSLAALLQDPGPDHAYVAIHLDGELVEETSLSELSQRSRELEGHELTMVGLQAPARSSALPAATTPGGCVRDCEQAWRARLAICERYPRPNCEEQADARLTLCLQVCGCPVAIREVQVVTTYVGDPLPPVRVCLHDESSPTLRDGHFYDRRTRQFRHDHYNEVVYCDGDHRIELGSVDYSIDRCIQRVPSLPFLCTPTGEAGPEARCQ